MSNKIWNGKIKGLLGAGCIGISILWNRLIEYATTRLFLANIKTHGKNIRVMPNVSYRCPSNISVSDDVIIGHNVSFSTELFEQGGFLEIKAGASVGNGCSIDFTGGVIISEQAHVAHDVLILTHNHGYDYKNPPIGKHLTINKNAFVGSRSVIMYNCNYIGKNAVVGTGSVVTKDVPDNAIVAGNPARIIKMLDV